MNGTYQVEPYHDEHFIIPAIKRFRIEHRIHHAQDTHPLVSVARAQLLRGGGGGRQSHHWSSFVLHAEDCKSNIWGVIIIRENFFLVQSTPSYNEILFKFVVGLLFCEWINKKRSDFPLMYEWRKRVIKAVEWKDVGGDYPFFRLPSSSYLFLFPYPYLPDFTPYD